MLANCLGSSRRAAMHVVVATRTSAIMRSCRTLTRHANLQGECGIVKTRTCSAMPKRRQRKRLETRRDVPDVRATAESDRKAARKPKAESCRIRCSCGNRGMAKEARPGQASHASYINARTSDFTGLDARKKHRKVNNFSRQCLEPIWHKVGMSNPRIYWIQYWIKDRIPYCIQIRSSTGSRVEFSTGTKIGSSTGSRTGSALDQVVEPVLDLALDSILDPVLDPALDPVLDPVYWFKSLIQYRIHLWIQ